MLGTSSPTQGAGLAAVIVPRSAVEAAADPDPKKAYDLVQAVIDFVNATTGDGLYSRFEIPEKAMQAYHADYYLAQVNNGGHSQFIHNGHKNLDYILADARAGLAGMNAQAHLFLLERMAAWIAENPAEAAQQTGFEGGRAMTLDQLDDLFYRADRATPMIAQSARWIASWPELSVVEDAACREALRQAGLMNPLREPRLLARSVANLTRQMTEWFHVGVGLACANAPRTEIRLAIGGGSVMEIEGRKQTAFHVRTNAEAPRLCVVAKTHAAAYELVQPDNPPMPELGDLDGMKQAIRDGRLARYQPPHAGRKLSHVPAETIERVIALATSYRAAPALDLLLRRAGIETQGAVAAPLMAEPKPGGAVIKWLVAAGGQPLFALSYPNGAVLLRATDSKELATVRTPEIEAHAARAEAGAAKA